MDYFHYKYQCPYLTSTDAQKIYCEGGCRMTFPTIARCRNWLHTYCASKDGWEMCSMAQEKTDYLEWKLRIQKEARKVNAGRKGKPDKGRTDRENKQ